MSTHLPNPPLCPNHAPHIHQATGHTSTDSSRQHNGSNIGTTSTNCVNYVNNNYFITSPDNFFTLESAWVVLSVGWANAKTTVHRCPFFQPPGNPDTTPQSRPRPSMPAPSGTAATAFGPNPEPGPSSTSSQSQRDALPAKCVCQRSNDGTPPRPESFLSASSCAGSASAGPSQEPCPPSTSTQSPSDPLTQPHWPTFDDQTPPRPEPSLPVPSNSDTAPAGPNPEPGPPSTASKPNVDGGAPLQQIALVPSSKRSRIRAWLLTLNLRLVKRKGKP
ncbi:hypothetical protein BJ508DRAFT_381080 [Ascobolus immersus RN42]|uniref:Uncharacterized protein n=1 Tax=Ascobolus immersus RN42 TaxID=1160509 RepID=A0A3N4HH86_ASCIM|nr:hypothetical protein BJ508DRAFT_381080 [Ascobolus immersus RN42]